MTVRDHDATVRKMAAEGATLRQIGEVIGHHHENVWKYLQDNNIQIDRRKRITVGELRRAMVVQHD